tara:strand:- start:314 stop:838 length:525 start_codon:yes stop_codon:yes gene_type:complete
MKYLVKLFVVTFLIVNCTYAQAQDKIAYIDMKYILNSSDAGNSAQKYLTETFKKNQKKFTDLETSLKKEEIDLLGKKNVLTKEEYSKKADELRKKVTTYQNERRQSLEDIAKKRKDARDLLIKKIDPIIKKYINENGISLLIDKKNIVMGNSELDITKTITEQLNKEFPSINLK